MSNRHSRRQLLRAFRADARQQRGCYLLTSYLSGEDVPPVGKLLRDALEFWQASKLTRRPVCIVCQGHFAGDVDVGFVGEVTPASYLFATMPNVVGVAVSAICERCDTLPLTEVEPHVERV